MAHVIVTPRSASRDGHPSLDLIRSAGFDVTFPSPGAQPTEDQLVEAMNGCVGYLAGVEPITRRVIEAGADLKVISRNGVGVDNVDVQAAEESGVAVVRAIGSNARGVAELAIGHMLAAARGIASADQALKRHEWKRTKGIELSGRKLGLVGCGSIGQIVATLALGIGMKVVAYDPYPPRGFAPGADFTMVDFDTVIRESEVISLHCPPAPDRFVIGRDEIATMKAGVILVNTARDGLMDPAAITEALSSGQIRAATVDAFATEPPADYSFVANERVVGTPHIGGFTVESVDRAMMDAVKNLLAEL